MKKLLIGIGIIAVVGLFTPGNVFKKDNELVGANAKISALTVLTSALSSDVLPIVDTSETKQITVANLFNLTVGLFGTTGSMSSNFEVRGTASASQYFNIPTQIPVTFTVINIPTTRAGAASSSTGYEYTNQLVPTAANTFQIATTSPNFAITMSGSGRIRGCSVKYDTLSTTGAVSVMITKNGVLQTNGTVSGKYCEIANFATGGNVKNSATQNILGSDITFVAGDRFGIVASSTGLSAATMDGSATVIFEITN